MRDPQLDSTKFCALLKARISKVCDLDLNLLRNQVVASSISHQDTEVFELKGLRLKDFIRLSVISYYVPPEIGFLLREDLREYSNRFSLEDRILCEQFLSSKTDMLLFLLETNLWHTRDFWGNMFPKTLRLSKLIKLKHKSTKITEPKRKRGYHDKGSRRESHKWLPSTDFSLTELQNQIEAAEESFLDTTQIIKGSLR